MAVSLRIKKIALSDGQKISRARLPEAMRYTGKSQDEVARAKEATSSRVKGTGPTDTCGNQSLHGLDQPPQDAALSGDRAPLDPSLFGPQREDALSQAHVLEEKSRAQAVFFRPKDRDLRGDLAAVAFEAVDIALEAVPA